MKVLVIGSGGREHALVWKIAQSGRVKKIFCAPGNGGTTAQAQNVPIKADAVDKLCDFAWKERVDLTIVGPEQPLADGIVDFFKKKGLRIFGPTGAASRLESSKVFAREFMARHGIPGPRFRVFSASSEALKYVKQLSGPCVVKADGLAQGKGAFVLDSAREAEEVIRDLMERKTFGEAGSRVLVEERLEGDEVSLLGISDGGTVLPLESAQDHKRALDEDKGPNTGGMGAASPNPLVGAKDVAFIQRQVLELAVHGLREEGDPFLGVLYAGIMLTAGGPQVLEFNVRFGDPEAQAILPRLKNDLVEAVEFAIDGKLAKIKLEWDSSPCVCVVAASGGYPGAYEKGKLIEGLEELEGAEDVWVFHAGTRREGRRVLTDGGRVLGVTARGRTLKEAIERAYEAVGQIRFDGMHYRKDIGTRALAGMRGGA